MVYEPREDSFLLLKAVEKYVKKDSDVLDIGTGSGILAVGASKKAGSVLAADVDPEAVEHVKKVVKREKVKNVEVIKSDLFSGIKQKFDCIIFNPPYLPCHPKDRDVALDGGPKGYELIVRFLRQAKKHLKKQGFILLLFSTLTKKRPIISFLKSNNYKYELVSEEKLDFERLFVYKIWR